MDQGGIEPPNLWTHKDGKRFLVPAAWVQHELQKTAGTIQVRSDYLCPPQRGLQFHNVRDQAFCRQCVHPTVPADVDLMLEWLKSPILVYGSPFDAAPRTRGSPWGLVHKAVRLFQFGFWPLAIAFDVFDLSMNDRVRGHPLTARKLSLWAPEYTSMLTSDAQL